MRTLVRKPYLTLSFGRAYNEFKTQLRWHDYINLSIHEFAFLKLRRYDWFDGGGRTWNVTILGFSLSIWKDFKW